MSVLVETSWGDVVIDLLIDEAPNTCKNFLKLCKVKYYNHCCFHFIQSGLLIQTGDPTATGEGGESIYRRLYGDQARYFANEIHEGVKHDVMGTVAMAGANKDANGSQFYITCRPVIDYLDGQHTVFGRVAEGMDVVMKINAAFTDDEGRPFQIIKVKHTLVLEDPFPDPSGLEVPPDSPPPPPKTAFERVRISEDEEAENSKLTAEDMEERVRRNEANSRANMLTAMQDLPDADVKPPDNVLFVCKLNPVTEEEDLDIIFSRFGKVDDCQVVKDRRTGESLCYAFVEFEKAEECEMAYFKMDNALIDDRRIKVDFSQSVSKLWNKFNRGGAYGGNSNTAYGMVFDGGPTASASASIEHRPIEAQRGHLEGPGRQTKELGASNEAKKRPSRWGADGASGKRRSRWDVQEPGNGIVDDGEGGGGSRRRAGSDKAGADKHDETISSRRVGTGDDDPVGGRRDDDGESRKHRDRESRHRHDDDREIRESRHRHDKSERRHRHDKSESRHRHYDGESRHRHHRDSRRRHGEKSRRSDGSSRREGGRYDPYGRDDDDGRRGRHEDRRHRDDRRKPSPTSH